MIRHGLINKHAQWAGTTGRAACMLLISAFLIMIRPLHADTIDAVHAPGTVQVGASATISVDYSAYSQRRLTASLRAHGDHTTIHVQQTKEVAIGRGNVTFTLPIDAGLPLATDAYDFVVVMESTEPDFPEVVDEVIKPLVDTTSTPYTDTILFISGPDDAELGESENILVEFTASTQRDLVCFLQLNSDPWTSYGMSRVTIEAGSGFLTIPIPVDSRFNIADDIYKYVMLIAPVGGNYPDRLDIKQQTLVDIIAALNEDLINGLTAPDSILSGDEIDVFVSYKSSANRELLVRLRDVTDVNATYGELRVPLTPGAGSAQLRLQTLLSAPIGTATCRVDVSLLPTGGDLADSLFKGISPPVDCVRSSLRDDVRRIDGPDIVAVGDQVGVSVRYEAAISRDLKIQLRSRSAPEVVAASATVIIGAGRGSQSVPVLIPMDTELSADDYEWVASIVPREGSLTSLLDELQQSPVGVSDSLPMVSIVPTEYTGALRNPLKGFRPESDFWNWDHPYMTLGRCYISWNDLENDESDTIEKIRTYCDDRWANLDTTGIKVIPRVILDWNGSADGKYWPADMTVDDYSSEQFIQRLVRLIERLGEVWDNDSRVAWVQMGLIGYFGEHHHPNLTPEMQTILGDAFARSFKNKKFIVRHANEFLNYDVGYYWDSFAHEYQINTHGKWIEDINVQKGRWKTHPIEGEVAYGYLAPSGLLGENPTETLKTSAYRETLIDTIRKLHCSALGWVADYDQNDPDAAAGAAEVQKAFGYRYLIKSFQSQPRADSGTHLRFSFTVENTGSAPFYEDWPLQFSLINPADKSVAWSYKLDEVDIRDWLPGDDWDEVNNVYLTSAEEYRVDVSVPIPASTVLPHGNYWASLAILDPSSMAPSVRFATKQVIETMHHPMVVVGIGPTTPSSSLIAPSEFTNPTTATRSPYLNDSLASISTWKRQQFTSAQISGGLADDSMDLDGDGLSTIQEFAFGTDPFSYDKNPGSISRVNQQFVFRYARPAGRDGITYDVNFSEDLVSWRIIGSQVMHTENGMEWIESKEPVGTDPSPKRFGQIITEPEP